MIKTLDGNNPQLAQYLIDKIKHDINRLHTEELARREWLDDENPQKMEIACKDIEESEDSSSEAESSGSQN